MSMLFLYGAKGLWCKVRAAELNTHRKEKAHTVGFFDSKSQVIHFGIKKKFARDQKDYAVGSEER